MALNDDQRQAVEEGGIQLILAGPGSGKTHVIIEKIRHLISSGVEADHILTLTFSDKTREETEKRLKEYENLPGLSIHTFHSFCLEVLTDNVLDSGIDLSAGLFEKEHQLVWALRHIDDFDLQHVEIGSNPSRLVNSMIDGISVFTDELISPEKLEAYLAEKAQQDVSTSERTYLNKLSDLLKVYKAYIEFKRTSGLIDFDDMLTECSELFERKPLVLQRYKEQYTHILVDEFQDTNYAQLALLKQLAGKNICVVGDDDQSIYRFRGAYLTVFSDFKKNFEPSQVLLRENYRNPGNILTLALQLMENAPNREDKPLIAVKQAGESITIAACENDRAEAEGVANEVQKLIGSTFSDGGGEERTITPRDIAILTRKKEDGEKFNELLRKLSIPTDFVGNLHFFQAPVIKDALAFLRVADNPLNAGPSLARIMRSSSIKEVDVQRINAWARSNTRDSMSDGVFEAMLQADSDKITQKEHIRELANVLARMHETKRTVTPSELVYDVLMRVSGLYKKSLQNGAWNDIKLLNKLVELARQHEAIIAADSISDLLDFFDSLSDFDVEVEEFDESDSVKIMTIHKSKGTEFPIVFVADLAERHLPIRYWEKQFYVPNDLSRGLKTTENEKALFYQDERRLFYVAMTRAAHKLYLIFPVRYLHNKKDVAPSPFLSELGLDDHPAIDSVEWEQEEPFHIAASDTSQLERVMSDLQQQAAEAINQMRLKTAVEILIQLERLRLFEAKSAPDKFDLGPCVICKGADTAINELVGGKDDPPLIDPNFTFSATVLDGYERCPAKCKYEHVLHVPTSAKPYLSLGTTLHTVFDQTSKLEAQGYAPTPDIAYALLDKSWSSAAYSSKTHESQDRAGAYQILDTFLAWNESNANLVLNTEYKFSMAIAGRTVNGKIDRIEQAASDDIVIVDFKTGKDKIGKKKIEQDLQANIYCLAVQDKYDKLPKTVAFYYPRLDETVEYVPKEPWIGAQKERIEGMIASMLSGEFPERPQWGCRWCDYACLCDGQTQSNSF